jgi:hypothetical protein
MDVTNEMNVREYNFQVRAQNLMHYTIRVSFSQSNSRGKGGEEGLYVDIITMRSITFQIFRIYDRSPANANPIAITFNTISSENTYHSITIIEITTTSVRIRSQIGVNITAKKMISAAFVSLPYLLLT